MTVFLYDLVIRSSVFFLLFEQGKKNCFEKFSPLRGDFNPPKIFAASRRFLPPKKFRRFAAIKTPQNCGLAATINYKLVFLYPYGLVRRLRIFFTFYCHFASFSFILKAIWTSKMSKLEMSFNGNL